MPAKQNKTAPPSQMTKKDLYDVYCNLKNDYDELKKENDNFKTIIKIAPEGEYTPAIYDKDYQDLLKKKLEFQDKFNKLNAIHNPDKYVLMIKDKEINRLKDELMKESEENEKLEDTIRKMEKNPRFSQKAMDRHTNSYNEILAKNDQLKKDNDRMKEIIINLGDRINELNGKDIKILKDTIYEKDEYIKDLHDKLKIAELDVANIDKDNSKLLKKISYLQEKHDLLYKYFNLTEPQ